MAVPRVLAPLPRYDSDEFAPPPIDPNGGLPAQNGAIDYTANGNGDAFSPAMPPPVAPTATDTATATGAPAPAAVPSTQPIQPNLNAKMPGAKAMGAPNGGPPPTTAQSAIQNALTMQPPAPPGPAKWYQKLAAMAEGAAGGWVNAAGRTHIDPKQIAAAEQETLAPGYARQVGVYQQQQQDALAKAGMAEKAEDIAGKTQQRAAISAKQPAEIREAEAKAKLLEQQAATLAEEGKRPPKGNYVVFGGDGLMDAETGKIIREPRDKAAADYLTIDPEKAKALGIPPQPDGTFKIPKEGIGPYITSQMKPAKPTTPKEDFQTTLAKLASEGNLKGDTVTDIKKLVPAIRGSKVLEDDEKNSAIAYLAANTTPAATGTNTTIRMEGLGQTKELTVLDTKNGNTPQFLNANEINRANQQEPGRYIPATQGTTALTRTALLEDIRGSINQTRQSLTAIPEFSIGDKAMIATALRDRDPKSAVSQLIGGAAGANMSPAQQDYLINLAQLHEQAMAMRSVLGAGAGSEDLRAAILRTIPGPGTPNKAYAARQLDQFEATLNRLSRGVPTVPLKNAPPVGGPPAAAGGDMIKVQLPSGQIGPIHASQREKFLHDHPGAKVVQ